MKKSNRRVKRTRELLQKALIELMSERDFDVITIREIADRANVGRTTFYLHYNSKDELFMSCHEAILGKFHLGPLHPLSRAELLSSEAPEGLTYAYQHLEEARAQLYPVFMGKDSMLILRQIRDRNAQAIQTNLSTAFTETDSTIPFDVLANYLAGAQIALVQWWLDKRHHHTLQSLGEIFHRLQSLAIRDAFGLMDEPSTPKR